MKITLITERESVDLSTHPFKLLQKVDLSGLAAKMTIVETGSDGGLFLNSKYNTRDVDFQGMIDCYGQTTQWIKDKKDLLYRICNPKEPVTIQIETDDNEIYSMIGYPISFPVFKTDSQNQNKTFQTFLLQFTCADPYLYKNQQVVTFATVTPSFSFPMSFSGVVFGTKNNTLIQSVYNDGMMDCPLEITIDATQNVVNPYLINVYTQEQIKLNTSMIAGDRVVINTGRKKEVSRYRSGVKTTFYSALDLTSAFLQLNKGDNIFRFGADSGQDYMQIQLTYQERMAGL